VGPASNIPVQEAGLHRKSIAANDARKKARTGTCVGKSAGSRLATVEVTSFTGAMMPPGSSTGGFTRRATNPGGGEHIRGKGGTMQGDNQYETKGGVPTHNRST